MKRIEGAFHEAKQDGIAVLCISFCMGEESLFNNDSREFVKAIDETHKRIAPDINFIPEICFGMAENTKPVEVVHPDQILIVIR